MRKFLMASAATLGAVGMAGAAFAQGAPPPTYLEGSVATNPNPAVGANNNNNYQGGLRYRGVSPSRRLARSSFA